MRRLLLQNRLAEVPVRAAEVQKASRKRQIWLCIYIEIHLKFCAIRTICIID